MQSCLISLHSCCVGETIPASDSDEETRGDESLEGIYRHRESSLIAQIVNEFGGGIPVLQCLSNELQLSFGESSDHRTCPLLTEQCTFGSVCVLLLITSYRLEQIFCFKVLQISSK